MSALAHASPEDVIARVQQLLTDGVIGYEGLYSRNQLDFRARWHELASTIHDASNAAFHHPQVKAIRDRFHDLAGTSELFNPAVYAVNTTFLGKASIHQDHAPPKPVGRNWPFGNLQPGSFGSISADVPWKYISYAPPDPEQRHPRHTERHYDTMTLDEIKALPVADLAAPDAHLWFWTFGAFLELSFEVLRAWGFRYSSVGFTWVKLKGDHGDGPPRIISLEEAFHVGLGKTTRKGTEICLLARRGSPRRLSGAVREVILAPVREHSRKPDEAYDRIRRYADGPYLELFSRENREGWTTWGAEAGKFDEVVE